MLPHQAEDGLIALAESMERIVVEAEAPGVEGPLSALGSSAEEVGQAWSGSAIGYHSHVYFEGLERPPHGAMFDRDWGFLPAFSNRTRGNWEVFTDGEVTDEINKRAGEPDLSEAEAISQRASDLLEETKWEASSILTALLDQSPDDHLLRLVERTQAITPSAREEFEARMLPRGPLITRDSSALAGLAQIAPHQSVTARVLAMRDPFAKCSELASLLQGAARHAARLPATPPDASESGAVFIGHGASPIWRELKDFLQDRLDLTVEEFNRVPTAGIGTTERLHEMLDTAAIAFLVLTAEDEEVDGRVHARQNVIHEVGLFQAKLGVRRAIVMLEEGCEEFSNIEGLGQIRFPAGNIAAKFEDVRGVLEREGLLQLPASVEAPPEQPPT